MMSNVESMHDQMRNRVAVALMDENGSAPTSAALDVIMAVIRETDLVDQASRRDDWFGPLPEVWRYAFCAERALRVLRKNEARR